MYKFNKIFSVSALILAIAFGLMGCGGTQTAENKGSNTTTTKPADNKPADNKASTDNKPADTPKTDGKETASADKIGVPECDEYIEKYEACLTDKIPAAQRDMLKSSFESQRKTWKDLAANPQTKASLPATCKQINDAAKPAMTAYGCKW